MITPPCPAPKQKTAWRGQRPRLMIRSKRLKAGGALCNHSVGQGPPSAVRSILGKSELTPSAFQIQSLLPGEPHERPVADEPLAEAAAQMVEHDTAVGAEDGRHHRLGLSQAIGTGSLVPGEVIHVRGWLVDISRVHHA